VSAPPPRELSQSIVFWTTECCCDLRVNEYAVQLRRTAKYQPDRKRAGGRVQKLTTGFSRLDRAKVAIRAACVIGIPGGFCGIRRRGPGRYSDRLSAGGRPPFRQPTVSVSSFSHHQPAVTAITKWSIHAPSSKKSPAEARLRLRRRDRHPTHANLRPNLFVGVRPWMARESC
jgi:hypothetical protein